MSTQEEQEHEIAALRRRVEALEAKDDIKRFMHHWGHTADQVEVTKSAEKARYLAHELMTPDGVCDFSAIPGWLGVWGPDKQQIIDNFLLFSQPIGWAYHIYPNASIDLHLAEDRAEYFTQAECVPLALGGKVQLMFLTQRSHLRRVKGVWKMVKYHLCDLRLVDLGVKDPPGL